MSLPLGMQFQNRDCHQDYSRIGIQAWWAKLASSISNTTFYRQMLLISNAIMYLHWCQELPTYLFFKKYLIILQLIIVRFLRQWSYLKTLPKQKTEVRGTVWYPCGKLLYPNSEELEILRNSRISRAVVIHMHSSFFPRCRASFLCWNIFPGSPRL